MRPTHALVLTLLVAAVLWLAWRGLSWITREDRWSHYMNGGTLYSTQTSLMSPDGRFMIYTSPRSGNGDIYIVSQSGAVHECIACSPVYESNPAISEDGHRLFFTRRGANTYDYHVWMIDIINGDQRQLTSGSVIDDVVGISDGQLLFWRSPSSPGFGRHVELMSIALPLPATHIEPRQVDSRMKPSWKMIPFDSSLAVNRLRLEDLPTDDPQRHLGGGELPAQLLDGTAIRYFNQREYVESGQLWMPLR